MVGAAPRMGIFRYAASRLRSLRWMLRRITRINGMASVGPSSPGYTLYGLCRAAARGAGEMHQPFRKNIMCLYVRRIMGDPLSS